MLDFRFNLQKENNPYSICVEFIIGNKKIMKGFLENHLKPRDQAIGFSKADF